MDVKVFNPAQVTDQLDEMAFEQISEFNDAHIGAFWSEAGGPGPWELHPDAEELLHVMEGRVEIEILPRQGPSIRKELTAGSFLIVPRGLWHRHNMLTRTKEMYLSPARTEHSNAEDPR